MFFKKHVFIILCVLVFLIPKAYYVYSAYKTNHYTKEKVYNSGDETHYLKIGKNLSKHWVYSDNDSNIPTEHATWRPPIWPFVLALFYVITHNIFGLILLKALLELGVILGALLLFKKHFKYSFFQLAPFLVLLLEPQYIKYSITFLSESITACLLLVLTVFFIVYAQRKKFSTLIIVCSALVVLCHPVSVFFVGALLLFYGLINIRKHTIQVLFHSILFIVLMAIWPIRNSETFDKGLYLTASQGAVLSKGWNKNVINNFNNVDGDLANEALNLTDFPSEQIDLENLSILDRNLMYKESTIKFIASIDLNEKLALMFTKVKANFNPLPMLKKDTFLDRIAIPFRIFYLFIFAQALYLLMFKGKSGLKEEIFHSCLVVLAIIIGQGIMSIYAYTGLRFNSIYGLALLFMGILINLDFLNKQLSTLLIKINQ
ncbi:hypothetical protein [Algibacter sp. 2305UL17-15]|uniref:hypothetical protein n=1 Tax=Algibacter sp. 2305UL17-15 TaxID=3231268 RepID=UPI0034597E8A